MTLYGEAEPRGKVLVMTEFKKVLTLYLESVLSEDDRAVPWGPTPALGRGA